MRYRGLRRAGPAVVVTPGMPRAGRARIHDVTGGRLGGVLLDAQRPRALEHRPGPDRVLDVLAREAVEGHDRAHDGHREESRCNQRPGCAKTGDVGPGCSHSVWGTRWS